MLRDPDAIVHSTRDDDGRDDELAVRYTVSTPLGPDWPIVSALGIHPPERTRQRHAPGMDGAITHWRTWGDALAIVGGLPREYRAWQHAMTHVDPPPETLDVETEDKLLASLDSSPTFRAAVRALILEGAV